MRRDSHEHRLECRALQTDATLLEDPDARALMRLLSLWADDRQERLRGDKSSSSPFAQISGLVSNAADFSPDRMVEKRARAVRVLAAAKRLLDILVPNEAMSDDELVRLSCIVDCNAFTVKSVTCLLWLNLPPPSHSRAVREESGALNESEQSEVAQSGTERSGIEKRIIEKGL